jgi:hypothetical protein
MPTASKFFEEAPLDLELCKRFHELSVKKCAEWDKAARIKTRWEVDLGVELDVQSEGDKRLRKIQYLLDALLLPLPGKWRRSEHQRKFHDAYIIACLPQIYGDEWEANQQRLLKMFRIRKITPRVLALTPRRFGKTVAVANFVCAMVLAVPGIDIATFSTGKRASGLMMEMVKKILFAQDGVEEKIVKSNQEQLSIGTRRLNKTKWKKQEDEWNDRKQNIVSHFHSYPSNPS